MTDTLNRIQADTTANGAALACEAKRNQPFWAFMDDKTDLHLEVSRLTPKYLAAREEFEETLAPSVEVVARYQELTEALVHVLVAMGAYDTDAEAREAVQALTYPRGAEMLVSRWVRTEGLATLLSSGEISAIAESVQDRIAGGDALDDLNMWTLAEPFLNAEVAA